MKSLRVCLACCTLWLSTVSAMAASVIVNVGTMTPGGRVNSIDVSPGASIPVVVYLNSSDVSQLGAGWMKLRVEATPPASPVNYFSLTSILFATNWSNTDKTVPPLPQVLQASNSYTSGYIGSMWDDKGGSYPSANADFATINVSVSASAVPGVYTLTGVKGTFSDPQLLNDMPGVTGAALVVNVLQSGSITARNVFYNNSYYDNNNVGIDGGTGPKTDSTAIDTSKSPLMTGGGTATFANWTGYTKGINGLIYDVFAPTRDPQASDFTFTNIGKAGTGSTAVSPLATAMIVLQESNPRRVRMVFTFGDNAVMNTWLKVDVGTGFGANAETHYWGNAVGDVGNGNTSPNITVTPADELQVRSHPTTALNRSPVTDPNDVNKTSLVDPADQLLVRSNNTTALNCVKYITR